MVFRQLAVKRELEPRLRGGTWEEEVQLLHRPSGKTIIFFRRDPRAEQPDPLSGLILASSRWFTLASAFIGNRG